MTKHKVLVLFLTFGEEKYFKVQELLVEMFSKCIEYDFSIVRIDNKFEKKWQDLGELIDNVHLYNCPGDNSHYEMSGWDKGFVMAKERLGEEFDLVLSVNDALLNSKPVKYLKPFNSELLSFIKKYNFIVGHIDTYARVSPEPINTILNPIEIYGYKSRWHVCTTFIILKYSTYKKSFPMTDVIDPNQIYLESYSPDLYQKNAPISKNYQEFLINHQTKKWYQKYEINMDSYAKFKLKTECIIREQYYTSKLKKNSMLFLDFVVLNSRRKLLERILYKFSPLSFYFYRSLRTRYKILKEQIVAINKSTS